MRSTTRSAIPRTSSATALGGPGEKAAEDRRVLLALLDSWDRNNTVLASLIRLIPEAGLDARRMEGSQTVAEMLDESAARVRDAVESRVEADRALDQDFAHPVPLLLFLIFREGYHHGQIKLALKAAGCSVSDDDAGPLVWDVWRAR